MEDAGTILGNIEFLEQVFAYARSGKATSLKDIRAYMQARRFTFGQLAQLGGMALANQLLAAMREAKSQMISAAGSAKDSLPAGDSVYHFPFGRNEMAAKGKANKTTKKTKRGRAQDRARVAGGQNYEVRYEAKKTGRSAKAVKKAVKRVGNSRKKVTKVLRKKVVVD